MSYITEGCRTLTRIVRELGSTASFPSGKRRDPPEGLDAFLFCGSPIIENEQLHLNPAAPVFGQRAAMGRLALASHFASDAVLPARLATTATSSDGSTGLEMCV